MSSNPELSPRPPSVLVIDDEPGLRQMLSYGLTKRVPVVVDVRDLWPDIFLSVVPTLARPLVRLLLVPEFRRARFVLSRAACITAVSEQYLAWALGYAGRSPTPRDRVFPHGYPKQQNKPEDLARAALQGMGVNSSRVVCCFVGSFGRTYDLRPVIAVARRMQERGDTRAQFVFAGDGERLGEWKVWAGGLQNVIFTGWLASPAIQQLLGMAQIGLAAYAHGAPQGLPNKVFEYMSSGLPVLSSLRGETESLLATCGCGLTYDGKNVAATAAALEHLLDSEERRQAMGRRGLEKFQASFSATTIYETLAEHLVRLAG